MKTSHFFRILLAGLLVSSATQAGRPPEYKAVYSLNKFGMHAAESSSSLQKQADGVWLYQSRTETKGFVSLFRKDRITERALLKETSGKLRPVSYHYIHEGSKKDRNRSIDFDWNSHTASSIVSGNHSSLEIQPQTIDSFSLQLKLMHDLQTGKRPLVYHVIKKGQASDYEFEIIGQEKVETGAGAFNAIKLKRSREDSERTTITWAAPELHYLPVKIQHIEPDGSQFSLILQSVNGKITEQKATSGQAATSR